MSTRSSGAASAGQGDVPGAAAAAAPTEATRVVGPLASGRLGRRGCLLILRLLPLSHGSSCSAQLAERRENTRLGGKKKNDKGELTLLQEADFLVKGSGRRQFEKR